MIYSIHSYTGETLEINTESLLPIDISRKLLKHSADDDGLCFKIMTILYSNRNSGGINEIAVDGVLVVDGDSKMTVGTQSKHICYEKMMIIVCLQLMDAEDAATAVGLTEHEMAFESTIELNIARFLLSHTSRLFFMSTNIKAMRRPWHRSKCFGASSSCSR